MVMTAELNAQLFNIFYIIATIELKVIVFSTSANNTEMWSWIDILP